MKGRDRTHCRTSTGAAVAQAIDAVGDDDVASVEPLRDRSSFAFDDAHGDRAHDGLPVVDDIDECALWALLHGGGRDDELRAPRIGEQLDVDELCGNSA